jgi:putative transposase
MKEANVWVCYKKNIKQRQTTNTTNPFTRTNLNKLEQNFDVQQPDQAWVQDITYIWTSEGWLYLAIIIDLYFRKVVGCNMGTRMKAQLVCDALIIAM